VPAAIPPVFVAKYPILFINKGTAASAFNFPETKADVRSKPVIHCAFIKPFTPRFQFA
jgi:hypothetical protein